MSNTTETVAKPVETDQATTVLLPQNSVALQRIITEVTNKDDKPDLSMYNRVYHRHNR